MKNRSTKIKNKNNLIISGFIKFCFVMAITVILVTSFGCEQQQQQQKLEPGETTYTVPVSKLEKDYGRLITVANMPTSDQNGTGDRLGLFLDESGTFWGIPLTREADGKVIGCVPPSLRETPVSDTLPADTDEILGAANEPTNWRGGTGNLELLLRKKQGGVILYSVKEVETKLEPICWSQSSPVQPLPFYRLEIFESK